VPSRSHSARIGQEVEVHYRWHPFHGRRAYAHYSEQRAAGRVIHVEIESGVVTALPDWMLDASICAGMTLGVPRVSVDALCDLHRVLLVRGFRRSSCSCRVASRNFVTGCLINDVTGGARYPFPLSAH
jgi:hypothetical protein